MKTLHFTVTIPGISDGMSTEEVQDWLWERIGHPVDAYYEAGVRVEPIAELNPAGGANPERDGNGCMIYQHPAEEGQ